MIEAVGCNKKVITYQKKKAKEQVLNMNAFASMDVKSFNQKIGVVTNIASNMISMKSTYKPKDAEYVELDKRIRMLRQFQGECIDATKGNVFTPPPKYWSKKQKFLPFPDGITEEQRNQIQEQNNKIAFNNKIAVDRKAYFFSYVYPTLKTQYDAHCKSYKQMCSQMFRCTLSQLIKKENKTKQELLFIHNYYKYMPVIKNNCTMNLLAYYIEDTEFDNKWKNNKDNFNYTLMLSEYFQPTNKKLLGQVHSCVAEAFKTYNRQIKIIKENTEMFENVFELSDTTEQNIFINAEEKLRDDLFKLTSNKSDIANYLIYVYYNHFKNRPKSWMWNIVGDVIIDNLKSKASVAFIPKECENGEGTEYMGKYYVLERVNLLNDCD